jgi:predicted nucleotidyltransferase
MTAASTTDHEQVAEMFATAVCDALGEVIDELLVFGSTVRGEARGIDSDVDIFVVLNEDGYEDRIREIAYDYQLDTGIVISIHTMTHDRFEQRRDHPFIQTVLAEGHSYA